MTYDPDEKLELTDDGYLPNGADVDGMIAEGWEQALTAVWCTYHYYGEGPPLPDVESSDPQEGVPSVNEYRRRRITEEAKYAAVTPIQALAANARLVELLLEFRLSVMEDARFDGRSWTEIGDALGMTDQAASDWHQQNRTDAR
ncbi:hypothetical protein AB0M12_40265 [Nocardia vinacea]|uniref:hypothetical protein n=1 Tax=Nocardia vinacea TaxID=96468 RepID=UPI003420C039